MWQVLRDLNNYNHAYVDDAGCPVDASTLPLDEIQCAGGINIDLLTSEAKRNDRYAFALDALLFITSLPHFLARVMTPIELNLNCFTAVKWHKHLECLTRWGVIEECDRGLLHISKYFAVPKGKLKNLARTIFNGKALSKIFHTPPPVHPPRLPEILRRMSTLNGYVISVGDIRHFFHQIRVDDKISNYFGVAIKDTEDGKTKNYRWRQLPMGHSYSPWVAQSIALMVMAYREDNEAIFFNEISAASSGIPDCLNIVSSDGSDKGFAVVYYDNLLIVCTDPELGIRIHCRLTRNMKLFNVIMGKWEHLTVKKLRSGPFEYLGVEVNLKRARNNEGLWSFSTSWRICPNKVPTLPWERDKRCSPREVARVIGKVIWRHTLRLVPFAEIYELIDILRKAGQHQRSTSWDDHTLMLDERDKDLIEQAYKELQQNEHIDITTFQCYDEVIIATDSSDNRWGYIKLSGCDEEWGEPWSSSLVGTHIFLKELIAAVWSIKHFVKANRRIVIGIDNTAAAHAIENLYSSNSVANVFLKELGILLRETNCSVVVVGLRSEDNAADPISRAKSATKDQRDRCLRIMMQKLRGMNQKTGLSVRKFDGNVRHSALPFEDFEDDIRELVHGWD